MTAKPRVAPLSGETIPRLELLGALTLARLISHVTEALNETLNIEEIGQTHKSLCGGSEESPRNSKPSFRTVFVKYGVWFLKIAGDFVHES